MNTCTDTDCPCEGFPTLAALCTFRAMLGLVVQQGLTSIAEYDQGRSLVAAYEAAWKDTLMSC